MLDNIQLSSGKFDLNSGIFLTGPIYHVEQISPVNNIIARAKANLGSGAQIIMLDNFSPEDVARAVMICDGRARLEVSGGIGLDNIEAYLDKARVDYISVGALTHSAQAVDIAMEILAAGP